MIVARLRDTVLGASIAGLSLLIVARTIVPAVRAATGSRIVVMLSAAVWLLLIAVVLTSIVMKVRGAASRGVGETDR